MPGGRNAHIASAAGAFWVTKIQTHRVYRLGLNGGAEPYAGAGAPGFADGPVDRATLAHPNGIGATPDERSLVVNTLQGPWRGDEETRIVLRRISLPRVPGLERITIPVGDLVFDALATGPAAGELVMLLHGFPQTGYAYSSQLAALGSAGYRAVAPDQRGYSPGARPAAAEAYAMSNLVSDVIGMADALGREEFHLVGHDWGGAVAWVTATRFPRRVRTLTVLSTPHFAAFGAELADPESDPRSNPSTARSPSPLAMTAWSGQLSDNREPQRSRSDISCDRIAAPKERRRPGRRRVLASYTGPAIGARLPPHTLVPPFQPTPAPSSNLRRGAHRR